jgi:hypothetical protein
MIDDYINEISKSLKLNNLNGLILSNKEIEVLDRYKIDYKSCSNMKDLLFLIDEELNFEDNSELEEISISISDRDYYMNNNH